MLTGRGQHEVEDTSPMKRYLIESVRSATSIIAIFDLFCRTFSMNYCVLSLAYCVYMASSIFLLQVQAAQDDHQAMRKLTYCIQCLQQVKQISPGMALYFILIIRWLSQEYVLTNGSITVIGSALNNINRELTAIGITIETSPRMVSQPRSSPPTGRTASSAGSVYQISQELNGPMPGISHPVFQPSISNNFGPDAMSMEPEVFETMSTLQPLSIRVGAIQDSGNRSAYA